MLEKGDIVYYVRYLPKVDIDEILQLKIRTIGDGWYVGSESKNQTAFIFPESYINKIVYRNRADALEYSKELKLMG